MKILGLKENYRNDITGDTTLPLVYLMTDSSLLKSGKPFFLPDFAKLYTIHTSLVIRISRLGKNISRRFASRYYDAVTAGITVTATGIEGNFNGNADASALATSFDGSVMTGDFVPVDQLADRDNIHFASFINDKKQCDETSANLAVGIDSIIEYVSRYYTLKMGDLIFTGYSDKASAISVEDRLQASIEGAEVLKIRIK